MTMVSYYTGKRDGLRFALTLTRSLFKDPRLRKLLEDLEDALEDSERNLRAAQIDSLELDD